MHRALPRIVLLLLLAALLAGCLEGLRTRTPDAPTLQPVCTPPPCDFEAGEVYHCPDSCPGGCGTICATATPAAE